MKTGIQRIKMQFNTKLSTLFSRTWSAFRNGFIETRDIVCWFKIKHDKKARAAESREDLSYHNYHYPLHCPAAILHFRDIKGALSYKKEGFFKTGLRLLALLLSAFIELPLLLAKSLIIDVITLPLSLMFGFIIDSAELAFNIMSDIASLPAAAFNVLANKAPNFKKGDNTNEERNDIPGLVPSPQARRETGTSNALENDYQKSAENNAQAGAINRHYNCGISFVNR